MAREDPLRIAREKTRVVIFTQHFKIVGDIHLPPGARVTDFLNRFVGETDRSPFFAVTDAAIYSLKTEALLYSPRFLNIHKKEVGILFPLSGEAEAL